MGGSVISVFVTFQVETVVYQKFQSALEKNCNVYWPKVSTDSHDVELNVLRCQADVLGTVH